MVCETKAATRERTGADQTTKSEEVMEYPTIADFTARERIIVHGINLDVMEIHQIDPVTDEYTGKIMFHPHPRCVDHGRPARQARCRRDGLQRKHWFIEKVGCVGSVTFRDSDSVYHGFGLNLRFQRGGNIFSRPPAGALPHPAGFPLHPAFNPRFCPRPPSPFTTPARSLGGAPPAKWFWPN